MTANHPEARKRQLIKNIPDVFNYNTLMYVGGHKKHNRNLQLCDEFIKYEYIIDVLEIYKPNCDELEDFKWINFIYNGDIRTFDFPKKYDIIMFWHGIEHLEKSELSDVIERLKGYAREYIIFGCPYGEYKQGEEYGNPNEVHQSHWYPEELIKLNMNVSVIGHRDSRKGNILSWIKL